MHVSIMLQKIRREDCALTSLYSSEYIHLEFICNGDNREMQSPHSTLHFPSAPPYKTLQPAAECIIDAS